MMLAAYRPETLRGIKLFSKLGDIGLQSAVVGEGHVAAVINGGKCVAVFDHAEGRGQEITLKMIDAANIPGGGNNDGMRVVQQHPVLCLAEPLNVEICEVLFHKNTALGTLHLVVICQSGHVEMWDFRGGSWSHGVSMKLKKLTNNSNTVISACIAGSGQSQHASLVYVERSTNEFIVRISPLTQGAVGLNSTLIGSVSANDDPVSNQHMASGEVIAVMSASKGVITVHPSPCGHAIWFLSSEKCITLLPIESTYPRHTLSCKQITSQSPPILPGPCLTYTDYKHNAHTNELILLNGESGHVHIVGYSPSSTNGIVVRRCVASVSPGLLCILTPSCIGIFNDRDRDPRMQIIDLSSGQSGSTSTPSGLTGNLKVTSGYHGPPLVLADSGIYKVSVDGVLQAKQDENNNRNQFNAVQSPQDVLCDDDMQDDDPEMVGSLQQISTIKPPSPSTLVDTYRVWVNSISLSGAVDTRGVLGKQLNVLAASLKEPEIQVQKSLSEMLTTDDSEHIDSNDDCVTAITSPGIKSVGGFSKAKPETFESEPQQPSQNTTKKKRKVRVVMPPTTDDDDVDTSLDASWPQRVSAYSPLSVDSMLWNSVAAVEGSTQDLLAALSEPPSTEQKKTVNCELDLFNTLIASGQHSSIDADDEFWIPPVPPCTSSSWLDVAMEVLDDLGLYSLIEPDVKSELSKEYAPLSHNVYTCPSPVMTEIFPVVVLKTLGITPDSLDVDLLVSHTPALFDGIPHLLPLILIITVSVSRILTLKGLIALVLPAIVTQPTPTTCPLLLRARSRTHSMLLLWSDDLLGSIMHALGCNDVKFAILLVNTMDDAKMRPAEQALISREVYTCLLRCHAMQGGEGGAELYFLSNCASSEYIDDKDVPPPTTEEDVLQLRSLFWSRIVKCIPGGECHFLQLLSIKLPGAEAHQFSSSPNSGQTTFLSELATQLSEVINGYINGECSKEKLCEMIATVLNENDDADVEEQLLDVLEPSPFDWCSESLMFTSLFDIEIARLLRDRLVQLSDITPVVDHPTGGSSVSVRSHQLTTSTSLSVSVDSSRSSRTASLSDAINTIHHLNDASIFPTRGSHPLDVPLSDFLPLLGVA